MSNNTKKPTPTPVFDAAHPQTAKKSDQTKKTSEIPLPIKKN